MADRQGLAYKFERDPEGFKKLFFGDDVTSSTLDILGIGHETHCVYEPSKQSSLARRFVEHYPAVRHFYTRIDHLGYGPQGTVGFP